MAARTTSAVVDEALGLLPRRLLALGIHFQAKFGRGITVLKRTFARLLGVSELEVKAALERLRAAGLERWEGMVVQLVPFTDRSTKVEKLRPWEVPVREFAPGVEPTGDLVVPVSEAAVSWAERALAAMKRGWGGARKGAGRPRKELGNLNSVETGKSEKISDETPSESTAEAAAVSSEMPIPDLGVVPTRDPHIRSRLKELGSRYIPPTPDEKSVPTVRTPPPPKISRARPLEHADVVGICAAYRGAVELRWPDLGRCFAFMRGDLAGHKSYPMLWQAAEFMREKEISPAAWCMFSADVWREFEITDGPPTPAFVFSMKRLEERAEWFNDEKDRYMGNTVMYSQELRELAIRHKAMWDGLIRENPQDRPSLMAVVDTYFPGDLYERMHAAAVRGQARLQQELDAAIGRGGIVW